ncbi:MAG: GGDEF domain-containing protein [Pseudomonadota bacterium]
MQKQVRQMSAEKTVQPAGRSDEVSARAIAFAQRHKTQLTPAVYAVWYTYSARENKKINAVLDTAMNTDKEITVAALTTLYNENLSPRAMSDDLQDIGTDLSSAIGAVSSAVEANIKEQTVFSGKLRSAKQSLSFGTSKAEVSAVIASLHKANQEHIATAQRMTVQLEKNRAQVSKLKSELIEAKKSSNTDYLTGLANRRLLDDQLDNAIFEAHQRKQKVSFLMASVDGLTDVTQKFGLTAGDNVVRAFAEDLKKELKGSKMAARFEGARFAILLPNTHDREAFAIAERVRKAFRNRDWVSDATGGQIGMLTASFGGALLESGETREVLIQRADQVLASIQAEGADQVAFK